jgi:uncharacterized damage-inducible protein DinB
VSAADGPLIAGTRAVLAGTPAALRAMLGALPEDVATRADGDGWSPRDVLAHVLSVEPWALTHRVRLMLDANDPAIPNVDEADALARSGFRRRSVEWLLEEFERARGENLAWLRALGADELGRSGRHAQLGTITVANVLHHIAFHDLDHVGQVAAMLRPVYDEGRGRMRDAY